MKLYDSRLAPNPRRVRIFLAEKGIEVPTEQVDMMAKQHLTPEYTTINPLQRMPALELDDGTIISESIAICRYFEALRPQPALFGTGAEEIANGNLDLSNRTERQASDLQQTVQAVKMLAAGVASNAGSASEANRLALEARKVAEEGGAMVNVVVNTMHSINENSKQVADIIGIINGIAFQTNILALNAAVEAARAGEQGRGFGVVAGEVRTLAQRSAQAAKEIKSLISRSTDEINVGYKEASAAGRMMGEIVGSVQRVSAVVQEIAASTALQSSGIEQIDDAITSIDQATQQNAALVEQSSAAATLLRDSAAGLMGAVSSFRVEGEPDRRGAGPSARPEAGSHP